MVIFATQDFGAGACAGVIVLVAYAVAFALAIAGALCGARLRGKASRGLRRAGLWLLFVSALLPLFCCVAPPFVVRLETGNFPIAGNVSDRVREGMSADEVVAALGAPHERFKQGDRDSWYYWRDSFGISWFGFDFGPDGRVKSTYHN